MGIFRRQNALVAALLLAAIAAPVSGGPVSAARGRAVQAFNTCLWVTKNFYLTNTSENWKKTNVSLIDLESGNEITFLVADKRWTGGWASVYPVNEILGGPELPWKGRSVIKVPYKLPFLENPYTLTARELRAESVWYQALHQPLTLARIENDAKYPKNAAWKRGKLPILPHVAIRTKKGDILVKPELIGITLDEILEKKTGTAEQRASLEDLYELTRAIANQVKAPRVNNDLTTSETTNPFVPDVNPRNILWVESQADLSLLGLSRPSFVFYEMTALHHRKPQFKPLDQVYPESSETTTLPQRAVGQ
ncbi:MAG: hypothetical protein HYR96_01685 [Deltaproteobacteria bacterium]|nr:hypothetical protein [Deltaproteobacteria bacterium]MBI3295992.1 hypothetical protein [Deltaproteobacteria bacterium]